MTLGRKVPVTELPPHSIGSVDYVDAFEIDRDPSDTRTAEESTRSAFDHPPSILRSSVLSVHRHVLRFELGPWSSPEHIIGWRVIRREPEAIHIETQGTLMSGHLVVRTTTKTVTVTTFIHYNRPLVGKVVWAAVSPLHRAITPYVLKWDSDRMTQLL